MVVPRITKNLLSVSKLTKDSNVDVIFTDDSFIIQNRKIKEILAHGRCEHGLYVLRGDQMALAASQRLSRPRASYELWHSRLGHVSFDIISLLNKLGCVSVTSLLPNPLVCSSCEMAKRKRLPFSLNDKRVDCILGLVHFDLWGPIPTTYVSEFC